MILYHLFELKALVKGHGTDYVILITYTHTHLRTPMHSTTTNHRCCFPVANSLSYRFCTTLPPIKSIATRAEVKELSKKMAAALEALDNNRRSKPNSTSSLHNSSSDNSTSTNNSSSNDQENSIVDNIEHAQGTLFAAQLSYL